MTPRPPWNPAMHRRQFAVSRAAEVVARMDLDVRRAPVQVLGGAIGDLIVAAAREIEKYLNEPYEEGRTP